MPGAIQKAVEGVRTGQLVFRDANRLRQILVILARHGFGAVVDRVRDQDSGLVGVLGDTRSELDLQVPWERRVLHVIQELGPTYIKLGQILSTRADVIPASLIDELQTLQNDVPPMALDDVRAVLKEELGGDLEDHFSSFTDDPLASASIAQVHRAQLRDGREVVVKVQRVGIQPQVEADLEIMGFLARTLEANFPNLRLLAPAAIVAQFEQAIVWELDFQREFDNIKRLRRNFEDNPAVQFPEGYADLSTSRVLTMDFAAGTKITEIDDDRFDVKQVVQTGVDAVVKMIFVDGFFHGDVHPGNLLVNPDNTLTFIDLGLCGRLSRRQRDQLVDLLVAVVRQDFEDVARVFWRIGVHSEDSTRDYAAFEADSIEVMERWFAGRTMDELEFSGFVRDLMEGAMRHRVSIPPGYTLTFKALVTIEGVAKQLAPEMDVISVARPYVLRIAAERYSPANIARVAASIGRDLGEALHSVPATTIGLLEDLRAGRARVKLDVEQLEQLQSSRTRAWKRMGYAVLAAATALSGTHALSYDQVTILDFPAVSFWFYILSSVLTFGFLFVPSRDDRD